jgi:uncharacterized protein with GYD domain
MVWSAQVRFSHEAVAFDAAGRKKMFLSTRTSEVTESGTRLAHWPGRKKEDEAMPAYVVLFQFTDQGIQNIKEHPQGIEQAHKTIEAMGGKVVAGYWVMGQYDSIGIYEFPSDEVAMTFLLGVGATGNVRTTTLKAFTYEQFSELVSKLP